MKILFIGDPHLRMERFSLALDLFRWIEGLIDIHKPDLVVNLGDTFHDHATMRQELMTEFREHVRQVTIDRDTQYFYVLGNHDQYKPNDATYHALQNYQNMKNFTIISERFDYENITFVPYFPKHEDFPLDTLPICVAHQTFIGADYGYMRESAGVDAGKVKADIIISGHIHKKQEFGKTTYPGIPYAQNNNDLDQYKGVLLFDSKTYDKQWIDSPFPMWKSINFEFTPDSHPDDLIEVLKKKTNEIDKWVLKLEGPKAEIMAFQSSKQYLELKKNKHIIIDPTYNDKEKKLVTIEAKTADAILHDFVANVYNGSVDKDKLTSTVLEVYDEVKMSMR